MKNRALPFLASAVFLTCSIITPGAYATDGAADVARAREAKQKYEKLMVQLKEACDNSVQLVEKQEIAAEKRHQATKKHREASDAVESSTEQDKATAQAAAQKAFQELQQAEIEEAKYAATIARLGETIAKDRAQIQLLQEEELNAMKKAAAAGHPEAKAFIERGSVAEAAVSYDRERAIKEGRTRSEHELSFIRQTAETNYDTAAKAGEKATRAYVKAVLKGTHPHLALYKAVPDKSLLSKTQQTEGRYHQGQELITKKYKNIGRDFFYKDTDISKAESVLFNMKGLGFTFPEGASVSYDRKAKTLEMTNTKASHDDMKELMKKYREEAKENEQFASRGVSALQALKFTSGKPNWNADVFVLVCVSELALHSMLDSTSPQEWEAHFKKEGVIKNLQKIQKLKGVTTLYIVEQGADMKKAKQYAKILKLKAPVTQAKNVTLDNNSVPEDGISIHDRTGRCRYHGSIDADIKNAIPAIEEALKSTSPE